MSDIGSKVEALRSKLGMVQKDLADAAGIPQATVSRIERGIIKQPRLEVLRRLAEALHVTVDYLADRTQRMSANDVVGSDPQAHAIFRGYQELDEDDRAALLGFVKVLQNQRKARSKRREKKT